MSHEVAAAGFDTVVSSDLEAHVVRLAGFDLVTTKGVEPSHVVRSAGFDLVVTELPEPPTPQIAGRTIKDAYLSTEPTENVRGSWSRKLAVALESAEGRGSWYRRIVKGAYSEAEVPQVGSWRTRLKAALGSGSTVPPEEAQPEELSALSDVNITDPQDGDELMFDGQEWVNG